MGVIGHATGGEQWNLVFSADLGDKRVQPFFKFLRDQIFSISGAINHMDVIVRIGVAHGCMGLQGAASYHRIVSAAPPALDRYDTPHPALPGLGSRLAIRASGPLIFADHHLSETSKILISEQRSI